ncbi:MAG: universal stress protein [Desulfovermiculus sp.]|nr:universal stress protein [Desulfovermiculus sp.]
MNQNTLSLPLHRILVPLDASENSLTALNTAAELAAALNAELEGLFVEDINLLQLCEFPFAREVSFLAPKFRRIDRAETERQLRIQAQRLQKILSDVAGRFHVPWKFRVTRGGVPAEVLAATENADLTILGRSGWSMTGRRQMGSTVRTVVRQGRGMTLIIQQGMRFQPPVQVVFTGSSLSEKAMILALDLGRKKEIPVVVLVAGEPENQEKLQERTRELIAGQGGRASLQILPRALDLRQIDQAVRLHGPGPLFIPCEEPQLHGDELQALVDSVQNPVLLVRSR